MIIEVRYQGIKNFLSTYLQVNSEPKLENYRDLELLHEMKNLNNILNFLFSTNLLLFYILQNSILSELKLLTYST